MTSRAVTHQDVADVAYWLLVRELQFSSSAPWVPYDNGKTVTWVNLAGLDLGSPDGMPDGGGSRVEAVKVPGRRGLVHRAVEVLRDRVGHQRDHLSQFGHRFVLGHGVLSHRPGSRRAGQRSTASSSSGDRLTAESFSSPTARVAPRQDEDAARAGTSLGPRGNQRDTATASNAVAGRNRAA